MSNENIPDVKEIQASDVALELDKTYTLAELSKKFEALLSNPERMLMNKEADVIKAAFYKELNKSKSELDEKSSQDDNTSAVEALELAEASFKELYAKYKNERREYNKEQERQMEANLKAKNELIEELKILIAKPEDTSSTFPDFRKIQDSWKSIGRVPEKDYKHVNETYHFFVNQFYDKLQLNREMRDLDFQKNLELKQDLCKKAEILSKDENIVQAFNELQKLHESWKDCGPVAKEYRDSLWDSFKEYTAVINKAYQAHFEQLKALYEQNLKMKEALCEKVEAFADDMQIKSSNEWHKISKEIEDIQEEWRKIGYASKKENQKIYDRFRAACDKFFDRKKEFYSDFKANMNENMAKKKELISKAGELIEKVKSQMSEFKQEEWKQYTQDFIDFQKQWKEIGAVPRKKSEEMWNNFKSTCDSFFDAKDEFFKNKKKEAKKSFHSSHSQSSSDKQQLLRRYRALLKEIETSENNIGFFANSKNGDLFVKQFNEKIAKQKEELEQLKNQILELENKENK